MSSIAELFKEGGPWLGAAHCSIQRRFRNGAQVTWGSNDEVAPAATVRDFEEIAAAAVVADRMDRTVTLPSAHVEIMKTLDKQREAIERLTATIREFKKRKE